MRLSGLSDIWDKTMNPKAYRLSFFYCCSKEISQIEITRFSTLMIIHVISRKCTFKSGVLKQFCPPSV